VQRALPQGERVVPDGHLHAREHRRRRLAAVGVQHRRAVGAALDARGHAQAVGERLELLRRGHLGRGRRCCCGFSHAGRSRLIWGKKRKQRGFLP
jgi:hypothetical protein